MNRYTVAEILVIGLIGMPTSTERSHIAFRGTSKFEHRLLMADEVTEYISVSGKTLHRHADKRTPDFRMGSQTLKCCDKLPVRLYNEAPEISDAAK